GLVVLGQQDVRIELSLERRVEFAARRMDARTLRLHYGVEQRRRGDRLWKEYVHPEGSAARLFLFAGIGADEHDWKRARVAACADALGGVEPVDAWQHPVEDNEAERIASSFAVAEVQQRESLFG